MGIVDTWHATSNFKIMTHALKKVLQKLIYTTWYLPTYTVCIFCNFGFLLAWTAVIREVFQTAFYERGRRVKFLYLSISWHITVLHTGQGAKPSWYRFKRWVFHSMDPLLGYRICSILGGGILEKTR